MRLYLSYKASSPTVVVLIENEGNTTMLLGPTLPVFLSDGVGITVVVMMETYLVYLGVLVTPH